MITAAACRLIKANRQAYKGGVKAPWGLPEPLALPLSPKRQARSKGALQEPWPSDESEIGRAASHAALHRPEEVSLQPRGIGVVSGKRFRKDGGYICTNTSVQLLIPS